MVTPRSRFGTLAVAAGLMLAACSGGDGTDLAEVEPDATSATTPTTPITHDSESDRPTGTATASADGGATDDSEGSEAVVTEVTAGGDSIVVDETGVPGLDDDDVFCRSWSRFGGSFQVVAVNAAFGASDDLRFATLEVVAAPTTASAYAEMSQAWPDDLADESDAALDDVYGPFARRLAAARTALVDAGATPADLEAIDTAWLEALATRRPDDPEVVIDLSDELWALVDEATPAYLDEVGPWVDDDSLVTATDIPETNAYLADNCPDQGVLAGQEVDESS
ncbi:MAG: hypothetical protein CL424_15670 [Acidimicrobiaceae bacterium]|nr:hypothetical protein [Acidimicrobiaceae bacterium]